MEMVIIELSMVIVEGVLRIRFCIHIRPLRAMMDVLLTKDFTCKQKPC
jgi:hypothetical protein